MKQRKRQSRKAKFDPGKEVRAIARERIGAVKSGRVIVPKSDRKKPKYSERIETDVVQD